MHRLHTHRLNQPAFTTPRLSPLPCSIIKYHVKCNACNIQQSSNQQHTGQNPIVIRVQTRPPTHWTPSGAPRLKRATSPIGGSTGGASPQPTPRDLESCGTDRRRSCRSCCRSDAVTLKLDHYSYRSDLDPYPSTSLASAGGRETARIDFAEGSDLAEAPVNCAAVAHGSSARIDPFL